MDAFCDLYESYKLRLYRYAYYRLRSEEDAEDAVSECFMSAWKQIRNLRAPEAFGGWLFAILSGCCGKIVRKQIEKREHEDGWTGEVDYEREDLNITHPDSKADTRLILREALEQLSEDDRNIVLLSVVGGFKSGEIASITGLKAGSVRSRLSRALTKMREYLDS